MNELFFALIRVALGTQTCLPHTPSPEEWKELYRMAKKQSLLGICFAGVQRLQSQDQYPPEQVYDRWMGMSATIQMRNKVVDRQCVELQGRLEKAGLKSSILKGQAVGLFYPKYLRAYRQPGDIDIYVDCGRKKAIEYARTMQGEVDWDYKHVHLNVFEGTEVEMHYVPEVFLNLWKNRKLQQWFREHNEMMFVWNGVFVTPSLEVDLFYILLHIYWHFLYEGVGMRQLLDYYFVLESLSNHPAKEQYIKSLNRTLKDFGMMRFTKGVMWIMQNVFGMSSDSLLCEPEEKEGLFILGKVMEGGNFGHHKENGVLDKKGSAYTVLRVVRSNIHMICHYPSEALWPPVYFIWHKMWKLINRHKYEG